MKYERITEQPENPFAKLVKGQQIAKIPEFALESGEVLTDVPVAYKTWGKLNERANNCMVICHALTGSADVTDWWGPLLGPGLAFDPTKFFIVCINALGSPYGTASPCTINPETGTYYGPEFPLTTVRDDARLQRLILDDLGVKQVAVVVGGSMGGMLVLEYAYFGKDYVRSIIPLATCARHSAWAISWGEAQRQSIYSDPKYRDGYYPFDDPPAAGLGAARMSALLTYRSRNAFESKFGRGAPDAARHAKAGGTSSQREPATPSEERWAIHNHGHRGGQKLSSNPPSPSISHSTSATSLSESSPGSPSNGANGNGSARPKKLPPHYFSAQSYLRYQGNKFVQRFDPNCYISITRKLDTHDVSRGRGGDEEAALAQIEQPALVIGISSDGLFTFIEQERLAEYIPGARLEEIRSPEGHDAFLLEFVQINKLMMTFIRENLPDIVDADGSGWTEAPVGVMTKASVFGEAESVDLDVTNW